MECFEEIKVSGNIKKNYMKSQINCAFPTFLSMEFFISIMLIK